MGGPYSSPGPADRRPLCAWPGLTRRSPSLVIPRRGSPHPEMRIVMIAIIEQIFVSRVSWSSVLDHIEDIAGGAWNGQRRPALARRCRRLAAPQDSPVRPRVRATRGLLAEPARDRRGHSGSRYPRCTITSPSWSRTGRCAAGPDSHARSQSPSLPLPGGKGDEVEVPLIGQIAAGVPLDAVELAEDTFLLSRRLVGHGALFMLRVKGDSMTGAAITDGDLVVVRQQQVAENGEIVAAQLDRHRDRRGHGEDVAAAGRPCWLMPHNPAYQPIPADDATILGKVVAVVRPARARPSRRRTEPGRGSAGFTAIAARDRRTLGDRIGCPHWPRSAGSRRACSRLLPDPAAAAAVRSRPELDFPASRARRKVAKRPGPFPGQGSSPATFAIGKRMVSARGFRVRPPRRASGTGPRFS